MDFLLILEQMKVNMRYEHSRVMPAPTPKAPGVGIPVNHHANVPTLPLHYVAVGSYITCGLVVYSIKAAGGIQEACLDMLLICLSTIVATIMASATWTCFRGDLSSWWNYTEESVDHIFQMIRLLSVTVISARSTLTRLLNSMRTVKSSTRSRRSVPLRPDLACAPIVIVIPDGRDVEASLALSRPLPPLSLLRPLVAGRERDTWLTSPNSLPSSLYMCMNQSCR